MKLKEIIQGYYNKDVTCTIGDNAVIMNHSHSGPVTCKILPVGTQKLLVIDDIMFYTYNRIDNNGRRLAGIRGWNKKRKYRVTEVTQGNTNIVCLMLNDVVIDQVIFSCKPGRIECKHGNKTSILLPIPDESVIEI